MPTQFQNTRLNRPLPHFMTSEAQDTIKDPKFDALTGWLAGNYNLSRPSAALAPACLAKNKAAPWLCLYVNETLPFVATPLYLVNQLASIWDTFCNIGINLFASILCIDLSICSCGRSLRCQAESSCRC